MNRKKTDKCTLANGLKYVKYSEEVAEARKVLLRKSFFYSKLISETWLEGQKFQPHPAASGEGKGAGD